MAARHHASLLLASLALVVGSVGCAAPSDADEAESSGEALSGRVTVGRVVQTAGDALRLRRSPSRETTQNIIGVLPKGTSVKILESAPNDGFYRVEVQDRAVTAKLRASTGWVYGEYLSGDSEEPVDPDESRTGTWDVPTEMRAKLVVRRCAGTFAPSLEDAVAGRSPWAAVAFDTNTFSKGMKVKIAQLDARSALNPTGKSVKLKILETATSAPDGPFTVTVCTASGSAPALETADGFVDVAVYAYW